MNNENLTKREDGSFLNRYTTLPFLLDSLVHKRMTLLSPSSWEDRNDSYYVERYKTENNFKTVLALCFTTKSETFHQWKVFANGSSGVCIEFDRHLFLKDLINQEGFHMREVGYREIKDVQKNTPPLCEWPFLKRWAFRDEGEFRIIYVNAHAEEKAKTIPLNINYVRKISLSPWLHETVADTAMDVIKSISGCSNVDVIRSSLIENARWMNAVAEN